MESKWMNDKEMTQEQNGNCKYILRLRIGKISVPITRGDMKKVANYKFEPTIKRNKDLMNKPL